jgi:hypothetical protein
LALSIAGGTKAVEGPNILNFMVPEDIEVSIIGADAKISVFRRVPLSVEFLHLEFPASKDESERTFIGTMPCVTFHSNFSHRSSEDWR